MRHFLWTVTALTAFALAPQAHAQNASKEETIGVGAGGVIGAVVGGPVGFIIGAAIGAKLGDDLDNRNDEIETLSASLTESESTVVDLETNLRSLSSDVGSLSDELEHMERMARPELLALMQSGIATDLLFRTDEHTLSDANGSRLRVLAQSIASMPDLQIRLDGFADERGDAEYNLKLSQKRIEFVREQLIAAGIDASRIVSTAHGETPAEDDSIDSYALERRVALTLFIDSTTSVAAN